jgi:hypothetical protein
MKEKRFIFIIYGFLTGAAIGETIRCRMMGLLVNVELERMCDEAVVAYFMVLRKNTQNVCEQLVSRHFFEPSTFRMQV